MSAVVSAYLLVAPEGFGINTFYGQVAGVCIAGVLMIWFLWWNNLAKQLAPVSLPERNSI